MKYKDIFKSWWFYSVIFTYFIFKVLTDTQEYGKLFLVEYIGILIGSFIGVLFLVTLVWILIRGISAMTGKITRG